MNFELKKSLINRAVTLNKIFVLKRSGLLKQIFFLFSVILFTLAIGQIYVVDSSLYFLRWALMSLSLSLLFLQSQLFFENYIKKPELIIPLGSAQHHAADINIADYLDFESAQIIKESCKGGWSDSYHLLFSLLKKSKEMDFVFLRMLIDKKQALRDLQLVFENNQLVIKNEKEEQCFYKTVEDSFYVAIQRGGERITVEDLFTALVEHNHYLKNILYREGLQKEDVFHLTSWLLRLKRREDPWLYKNLIKRGRIGIEWTAGYTPLLDIFSIDWTRSLKAVGFPETIGHKNEASSLERVLARSDISSALLVGEPGSGRKSIVQRVIRNSFLGECLGPVNYLRFLELDLTSLIAQAQGNEETERLLNSVFNEVISASNVVLIINDIHNYVGGIARPGVVNISGVLTSYLHHPSFRVIGITSYTGFRQEIEKNASVVALFEKIEIREVGDEDIRELLEKVVLGLERKYHQLIPFSTIKEVINLSSRYMQEAASPEKEIDLLEEVAVAVAQQKRSVIMPKDVDSIVSERTEVPVGDITSREKEVLLNMESLVHERMINQKEAVKAVAYALRRSRADIDTRRGLIGSFLFLGPTGVGKTEMAKAISNVYFGSEDKMNRIDMSEFQSISDIGRLIGSATEDGILTSRVRENPFSLILLDEIEKSHPDVLNIFLQILDEGHLTDGVGRKVSFKNCMVIATSNAGYQMIIDALGDDGEWRPSFVNQEEKDGSTDTAVKRKILENIFKKGIFRPEFVNRFDEVVLFKSLRKEELRQVAQLQLEKMVKTLKEKDISFVVTDELRDKIVDISYDPMFGAREMQRAIQNNIGDVLSSAMLRGEINKGDVIKIEAEDFSIKKLN